MWPHRDQNKAVASNFNSDDATCAGAQLQPALIYRLLELFQSGRGGNIPPVIREISLQNPGVGGAEPSARPGTSPTRFLCEDGRFLSGCTRSRGDHTALCRHRGRPRLSAFVKWKTSQTTQVGELSPSFLHQEAAKWFKCGALRTPGTPLRGGSRGGVKTPYLPLFFQRNLPPLQRRPGVS